MQLPKLQGQIERRLLVNYRVDPATVARLLPPPFRPQLVGDFAVAGICLIRLGGLRPTGAPRWLGMRTENAAHRIAVEWDTAAGTHVGVYIPRRDSNSWATIALGGRVYPGEHHRAHFDVSETDDHLHVGYRAVDGSAAVGVDVDVTDRLTGSVLFPELDAASAFFEQGAVGYSATSRDSRLEGLKLRTSAWRVEPTVVKHAHSTFFEDRDAFPVGTAELDCALVMRQVPVVWEPLAALRGEAEAVR